MSDLDLNRVRLASNEINQAFQIGDFGTLWLAKNNLLKSDLKKLFIFECGANLDHCGTKSDISVPKSNKGVLDYGLSHCTRWTKNNNLATLLLLNRSWSAHLVFSPRESSSSLRF